MVVKVNLIALAKL